jgi:hypothetical protein
MRCTPTATKAVGLPNLAVADLIDRTLGNPDNAMDSILRLRFEVAR